MKINKTFKENKLKKTKTYSKEKNKNTNKDFKKSLNINKIKVKCESVSAILKTLSHPERLLLLCQLTNQKQTVSSLVEKSSLSQSQTSQYLKRLESEGFVSVEKQGKFRFYSIKDNSLTKLIKAIQKIYC